MARISRGRHNHQTLLANDPTKDISANQWNDVSGTYAHIETGMFGIPESVAYQQLDASGNITPIDTHTTVAAHLNPGSGTDTLKNIVNTNVNDHDILFLMNNMGDTITVNHNDGGTGNIYLLGGINKVLQNNVHMILFNMSGIWYESALTGTIVNAEVSANAAIAYSKLNLSGSIQNSDIANSAAIVYSKLNLSNSILDADVNTSAAIKAQKISFAFPVSSVVGGASEYVSVVGEQSSTINFSTTAQTGDYISNKFGQATLVNPSSGTVVNATTLKILGPPIASTNMTFTKSFSLWVAGGISRFDAGVTQVDAQAVPQMWKETVTNNGEILLSNIGDA